MDLRKSFDSVNRDVLWKNSGSSRNTPKLVNLISGMCSGTKSAVRCDGFISDHFPVNTGVLPLHFRRSSDIHFVTSLTQGDISCKCSSTLKDDITTEIFNISIVEHILTVVHFANLKKWH